VTHAAQPPWHGPFAGDAQLLGRSGGPNLDGPRALEEVTFAVLGGTLVDVIGPIGAGN